MNTIESNTRISGEERRQPATRDWVKDQARKKSAKALARLTDLSPKGAEKVRAGESSLPPERIVDWCRRDPEFRAQFFAHCGGFDETDPEFIVGITKAITNIMRGVR